MRDTFIIGIAHALHASLTTRKARHFGDLLVPVVNPWTEK